MPFQPMNFANIAPQGSDAVRNLIENLVAGYKAAQVPRETQLSQEQQMLANALSKRELTAPPKIDYTEFEKLLQSRERYPEGSYERKLIDSQIANANQPKNGIGVSFDENGQPRIQIGGSSSNTQGGTFIDPATGKVTSQLNNQNLTQAQQSLIGEERLHPIIKTITEKLPQFQSYWNQLSSTLSGLQNRFLGGNNEAPSEQKAGKAATLIGAETIKNTYNLPNSEKTLDDLQDILTPDPGESAEFYKKRVAQQVQDFIASVAPYRKAIKSGIDVSGGSSSPKNERVLIYNPKTGGFD